MKHSKAYTLMSHWYQTPLGELVAQAEQAALNAILPRLYGYHLLQLNSIRQAQWLIESPILHRMSIASQMNQADKPSLYGKFCALPFKDESLDVVLLPHVLEFVENPQVVVHEAWRTLIGEGHLVILVFNRMSIWGLWRLLKFNWHAMPQCRRFLAPHKIRRWLLKLGCDIVEQKNLFYFPPTKCVRWLAKFQFIERIGQRFWPKCGAVTLLLVRKKLITLTSIKNAWNPTKALAANGLEPTPRGLKLEVHHKPDTCKLPKGIIDE